MEQIYTIPINEAFEASMKDESLGCPFCRLYRKLEDNELELILGASMMEPEIRQKTNQNGFCSEHWHKMYAFGNNRLPLALILESHLQTVGEQMKSAKFMPAVNGSRTAKGLGEMSGTCYICDKLEINFAHVLSNAAYLWQSDPDFREKCAKQPNYCIKHYAMFLEAAKTLKRKDYADLYRTLSAVEQEHITKLKEDISGFIKQFDYRYEGKEEVNRHAIEDAVSSLTGEEF